MKLYKSIMAAAAIALGSVCFTACDDDPELPPLEVPESTFGQPNTTIYDLKKTYWSDERNYADTVGLTASGAHTIISGRVISSDSTGNIYKSLIIQDGTAAMAISLDTTKLYLSYPIGEEVVIDMTGCYVGKYNGLFQMGNPQPYNNTMEISFMSYTPEFVNCAQRNGLPQPEKIDTVFTTIAEIKSWKSSDSIAKYQSQLICLKDVSFVGGGTLTWADNGQSANRSLKDAAGNTLTVRNSPYSSFAREVMPAGKGTVVCILSYYGTDWQLLMRTALDCHDFDGVADDPSTPGSGNLPAAAGDGSADTPYNITSVLQGASGSAKWVTGYIVGWVDGASISEGAHFDAEGAGESNILIAATPDETDIDNCVPVQLSYGTQPRTDLNLKSHPDNLGKQVSLQGDLLNYFNVKGVKTVTAYVWGDKGGEMTGGDPAEPAETASFVKTATIKSGNEYLIVAGSKLALPLDKEYGYLSVSDVTAKNDTITTAITNAFTFTAETDGSYTIKDGKGYYLYMTGSFNSFNRSDKVVDGAAWEVSFNDKGECVIKNTAMGKTLQYSQQYTSFGAYTDVTNTLPVIYEKVK